MDVCHLWFCWLWQVKKLASLNLLFFFLLVNLKLGYGEVC